MPIRDFSSSAPVELRELASRADELASELRALAVQLELAQAPAVPPAQPPRAPAKHEGRIWLTSAQAATCHTSTILKACEAGELHGTQRTHRGRWRIHVDCLDAWCAGEKCSHHPIA